MVCGSRFLDRGLPLPGADQPPHRHPRVRVPAVAASSRQRVTDPTSGFRLYNRRAIELFARDYPHDYPEVEAVLMLHHHRLRMREVPVRMFERGGGVSSISAGQVGLLHGQGAARAVRRPVARRAGRRARRRRARRGGARASDGHAASRSSPIVAAARAAAVRARAGAPPPAAGALRAAVAVAARSCCSGWRSGAAALAAARRRGRHRLPAERAVLRGVRLRPAAAAALLGGGLAAGRPDEGARPAARAARGARAGRQEEHNEPLVLESEDRFTRSGR